MKDKLYEILNKLDDIHYGWVDRYNVVHKQSKKDFFINNYKFMSIEETLNNKVGTCFEQTELIRYYLEQESIPCKNYIIIYNDNNKIASHTICVAEVNDKYYLMESSWILNDENIEFSSTKEILNKVVRLYPKMYKIEPFDINLIDIYEYDKPTPGLSFKEFQNYTRTCNKIELGE